MHHAAMQQEEMSVEEDNQLVRAVTEGRRVVATYNGKRLCLEPHLLFFRHGEPYLLANNIAKQQADEAEPKLGQFKVAGLTEIILETDTFSPVAGFDGLPPRADDAVVLTVTVDPGHQAARLGNTEAALDTGTNSRVR